MLAALLLAALAAPLTPHGARAAPPSGAQAPNVQANVPPQLKGNRLGQVQARRAVLFDEMMADPANLDVAFEYATLSSQAGDLEGAVSTLERMLIFAPDVPRLQLELGVLYFRLGSYQLSQNYLTAALKAPNVPPAVKARVEAYMTAIETRMAPQRFSGAIAFGTRYQTNANGGASSDIVDLGGIPLALDESATADADVNGFVSGTFHYSYDFASQGDRFEADLLAYGALYGSHHEIDTALAELTFGPVFALDRFGVEGTEFGAYGILGGVALKGDPYRLSGGGGLSLATAFTPSTRGELRLEYRREDYRDSVLRPGASRRSGDDFRLLASLRHQITNRFAVFTLLEADRHAARHPSDSHRLLGATLGATYLVDPPLGDPAKPWIASLSFGALERRYDGPAMALVSFDRRDTEAFVQGALTVPLSGSWAVQAVVGYRDARSNFDLYTYDNASTSLGFIKGF